MTLDTARDLSLQVAAIPMTFFGMLMNSPHTWLRGMCHHKKRRSLPRFPQVVNERIIANHSANSADT